MKCSANPCTCTHNMSVCNWKQVSHQRQRSANVYMDISGKWSLEHRAGSVSVSGLRQHIIPDHHVCLFSNEHYSGTYQCGYKNFPIALSEILRQRGIFMKQAEILVPKLLCNADLPFLLSELIVSQSLVSSFVRLPLCFL